MHFMTFYFAVRKFHTAHFLKEIKSFLFRPLEANKFVD